MPQTPLLHEDEVAWNGLHPSSILRASGCCLRAGHWECYWACTIGPGQKHARSDNNLTAQATELWCPWMLSFASRDAVTDFNSSRRIFELSADEMSWSFCSHPEQNPNNVFKPSRELKVSDKHQAESRNSWHSQHETHSSAALTGRGKGMRQPTMRQDQEQHETTPLGNLNSGCCSPAFGLSSGTQAQLNRKLTRKK